MIENKHVGIFPLLAFWLMLGQSAQAQPAFDFGGIVVENLRLHYNQQDNPYLIKTFEVVPSVATNANTGMDYSPTEELFYHSNFIINSGGIRIRRRDNTQVGYVNLSSQMDMIQGLEYDARNQVFLIWATREGVPYTVFTESADTPGFSAHSVFRVSRQGVVLGSQPTLVPLGSPGSLEYDEFRDCLWLKPNDSPLAACFDTASWEMRHYKDFEVMGEGIAVSPEDGSVLLGTNTQIRHYDAGFNFLASYPNPSVEAEMEDMVVDPTDGTVWFNADEWFHGYEVGGNRAYHIDPFKTYDKSIRFPEMFGWQTGFLQRGFSQQDASLRGADFIDSSIWVSPIISLGPHDLDSISYKGNARLDFYFRSSPTPPSTDSLRGHARGYHLANPTTELGWGTTVPSAWTTDYPQGGYVQVMLVAKTGVVVNEWAAGCSEIVPDEAGRFSDWLELYNTTDRAIDLSALRLRFNDPAQATPVAPLPAKTLLPGEHLLLWADGEPSRGDTHLDFLLSGSAQHQQAFGEAPCLPVARGLLPDGGATWDYMPPTPGASNSPDNLPPMVRARPALLALDEDSPPFLASFRFDTLFVDFDATELAWQVASEDSRLDSVRVEANFGLRVFPRPDAFGDALVSFTATDPQGARTRVEWDLRLRPVNDAPLALPEAFHATEDQPFANASSLLLNDFDVDPSDLLSASPHSAPRRGALALRADGFFDYVPQDDFQGVDTFFYKAFDGLAYSEPCQVLVFVANVNDAPRFVFADTLFLDEDRPDSISAEALAVDIDHPLAALSFSLTGNPLLQAGFDYPWLRLANAEADWNGLTSLDLVLDDGEYQTPGLLWVRVRPINDPPTWAEPDTARWDEDEVLELDLSGHANDIDHPDAALELLWDENPLVEILPQGLSVRLQARQEHWHGTTRLTGRLTDGLDTVPLGLEVLVRPVNDPPALQRLVSASTLEDQAFYLPLDGWVSDVETPLAELQATLEPHPWLACERVGDSLRLAPAPDAFGSTEAVFLFDDGAAQRRDTVEVLVGPVNDPPALQALPEVVFDEDEASAWLDLSAFVSDNDHPLGELAFGIELGPELSIESNFWEIRFSAEPNWHGAVPLRLRVDDGQDTTWASFQARVVSVNDLPVLNVPNPLVFEEGLGTSLELASLASDVETPVGELSFSWFGNQQVRVEVRDGRLWVSNSFAHWNGQESFTIRVDDGVGFRDSLVTFICQPVNDPPTLELPPALSFLQYQTASYDFSEYVSDVDDPLEQLSLTWTGNQRVSVEREGMVLRFWSDVQDWSGSETLWFTVGDGQASRTETVVVNCLRVNQLPALSFPAYISFAEDTRVAFPIADYVSDDAPLGQFSVNWLENEDILLEYRDGWLSFTNRAEHWNGQGLVSISVTDYGFLSSTTQVQVNVQPVNDDFEVLEVGPEWAFDYVLLDDSRGFWVEATDRDSELAYEWRLDGLALEQSGPRLDLPFDRLGDHVVSLKATDGEFVREWAWEVFVVLESITDAEQAAFLSVPNPFQNSTRVSFNLRSAEAVSLEVYDLQGRLVNVLVPRETVLPTGEHWVEWDGSSLSGAPMPAGVYLLKFIEGEHHILQKIVLIR